MLASNGILEYMEEEIKVNKMIVLTENAENTHLSVKLLSHTANLQRKYYTCNSCEVPNNIKFS